MVQICKPPRTPKQAALLKSELDELLAVEVFRALADPTRNRLLSCLAKCGRACSVSEVAECCSVDVSVVSRHLAILESAGILSSSKVGRTVFYMVESETLASILRNLARAFEDCCNGKARLVSIKGSSK